LEKNIKDQFKSSAVMLQEVPQSFSVGKKNLCQLRLLSEKK
jgi:hypothetical protein